MQYLARTVEIAFLEHSENDTPTFRFSPEIWAASVNESSYVSAQEELRLVMADDAEDEE